MFLRLLVPVFFSFVTALAALHCQAASGKLLLTGGVSSIDGAAGGGLTPWALIGSHGAEGQFGATVYATVVRTHDYALASSGLLLADGERLELSLARQDLDTRDNLAALGFGGLRLKQGIVGIKLRVAGDAVLDSDTWLPQIAVGLLHKSADSGALASTLSGALGARDSGTEAYFSASKLFLVPGVLVNATLRATRANQGGLLGFGGAQAPGMRWLPEVSVGWLLGRGVALGAEYRAKPDNLQRSVLGDGALQEDDWMDVYVAWAPSKSFALTAAWVDLGRIVPALQPRRQRGAYFSGQVAF